MTRSPLLLLAVALLAVTCCDEATGPIPDADPVASQSAQTPGVQTAAALAPAWSNPTRVLFLHRSVGLALIRNEPVSMYDVLGQLNATNRSAVEMWHHGCGSNPYWNRYYDGGDRQVVPNFGPALSESWYASPEHWKKIFCDGDAQYVAARDSIDNFRVIAFKSGYDNTVALATDRAGQWRQLYRAMRDSRIFADPTRRIILLGFPPVREGFGTATQADADSSRAFNTWLAQEFVPSRRNLFAFPLFDRLAGEDNWLRDEYEKVDYPNDSHPNAYGCEIVGRELMTFIYDVATHRDIPPKSLIFPCSPPIERDAIPTPTPD